MSKSGDTLKHALRVLGDNVANLQGQIVEITAKAENLSDLEFIVVIEKAVTTPPIEPFDNTLKMLAGDLRGLAVALDELAALVKRRTDSIIDRYANAQERPEEGQPE